MKRNAHPVGEGHADSECVEDARPVVDKHVRYTKLDQVTGGKTVKIDTTKHYYTPGNISGGLLSAELASVTDTEPLTYRWGPRSNWWSL